MQILRLVFSALVALFVTLSVPALAGAAGPGGRLEFVGYRANSTIIICSATVSGGNGSLAQVPYSLETECNYPVYQWGNAILGNVNPFGANYAEAAPFIGVLTRNAYSGGTYQSAQATEVYITHAHVRFDAPAGYQWVASADPPITTDPLALACDGVLTNSVHCTLKTPPFVA
jgi:hypothetical protein